MTRNNVNNLALESWPLHLLLPFRSSNKPRLPTGARPEPKRTLIDSCAWPMILSRFKSLNVFHPFSVEPWSSSDWLPWLFPILGVSFFEKNKKKILSALNFAGIISSVANRLISMDCRGESVKRIIQWTIKRSLNDEWSELPKRAVGFHRRMGFRPRRTFFRRSSTPTTRHRSHRRLAMQVTIALGIRSVSDSRISKIISPRARE